MTTLNRRSFITTAAIAPLAGVAMAGNFNEDDNLELLDAIHNHTGLSLDELADWFDGIPTAMLEKIMYNVLTAPVEKWSYQQTILATMSVKVCEIPDTNIAPNQAYNVRQVVLKGNRAAIKKIVGGYISSGCAPGVLGEFS